MNPSNFPKIYFSYYEHCKVLEVVTASTIIMTATYCPFTINDHPTLTNHEMEDGKKVTIVKRPKKLSSLTFIDV